MKNLFYLKRGIRGQALVETAIILPIILFILFIMISLCFFAYDKTVFLLASNKALDAWVGIMPKTDMTEEEKEDHIKEIAQDFTDMSIFVTDVNIEVLNDSDHDTISIDVEGRFDFALPFVKNLLGSNTDLESECTFTY